MESTLRPDPKKKVFTLAWNSFCFFLAILNYAAVGATLYHFSIFMFYNKRAEDSKTLANTLWNMGLLCVFVISHSVLASRFTKNFWISYPRLAPLQRSFYLMITSLTLELLVVQWKSWPVTLWSVPLHWESTVRLVWLGGWGLLGLQTLLMDHGELGGLKQVLRHSQGKGDPMEEKNFAAQRLYRHFRHPAALLPLLLVWLTLRMSLDRFLLAASLSLYLLWGHSLDAEDFAYVEEQLNRGFHLILQKRPHS